MTQPTDLDLIRAALADAPCFQWDSAAAGADPQDKMPWRVRAIRNPLGRPVHLSTPGEPTAADDFVAINLYAEDFVVMNLDADDVLFGMDAATFLLTYTPATSVDDIKAGWLTKRTDGEGRYDVAPNETIGEKYGCTADFEGHLTLTSTCVLQNGHAGPCADERITETTV